MAVRARAMAVRVTVSVAVMAVPMEAAVAARAVVWVAADEVASQLRAVHPGKDQRLLREPFFLFLSSGRKRHSSQQVLFDICQNKQDSTDFRAVFRHNIKQIIIKTYK
jgi:hypothetical protein